MPPKQLPSQMTRAQFVAAFADIFEESPWVAERTWDAGISAAHDTPAALAAAMAQAVEAADSGTQQALIMAHPVLGTKKKMGVHSTHEQRQSNLDSLQQGEAQQLRQLNDRYMEKFGMPFIMAVKGADSAAIIAALRQRLEGGSAAAERRRALEEICKIARFRLEALWQ